MGRKSRVRKKVGIAHKDAFQRMNYLYQVTKPTFSYMFLFFFATEHHGYSFPPPLECAIYHPVGMFICTDEWPSQLAAGQVLCPHTQDYQQATSSKNVHIFSIEGDYCIGLTH